MISTLPAFILTLFYSQVASLEPELKCEPIKIEVCSRLGYKETGMPNLLGHTLQGDAQANLKTFYPLIKYNCAPDLLFFLCSAHVPMCVSLPPSPQSDSPANQLIGPCRPMCERVRSACAPVLQEFALPWPVSLECHKFPPANNLQHMCMDGGNSSQELATLNPSSALNSLQNYPSLIKQVQDFSRNKPELTKFDPYLKMLLETSINGMKPAQGFSGKCPGINLFYLNRTGSCIPKCGEDVLFSQEDKHFASIWLAVWSILCFLTSLFTLLTYLLDRERFQYPERCVIFLNLSFNLVSLGYLLRLVVGGEGVACTAAVEGEPSLLVTQDLTPRVACTVVFIMVYYSSLAAAVWWAITTITWTIIIFCSLDPKSFEAKSPLFHLIGWGIPAAHTISALVLHQAEGDELTGICLPGQQTEATLLHQLVIPHAIFLGSASIFFLCGVVASLTNPGERAGRLLARIGIFSIFYTLPQVCVVGSLVYEWIERPEWRKDPTKRPIIEVFMMRISMWLVVGIISGSWVWSQRTVLVWRNWFNRCLHTGRHKKPPTPVFPKVAYKSAALSDPQENVLTLENIATLRRGEGTARGETVSGLPFTIQNNRVIL